MHINVSDWVCFDKRFLTLVCVVICCETGTTISILLKNRMWNQSSVLQKSKKPSSSNKSTKKHSKLKTKLSIKMVSQPPSLSHSHSLDWSQRSKRALIVKMCPVNDLMICVCFAQRGTSTWIVRMQSYWTSSSTFHKESGLLCTGQPLTKPRRSPQAWDPRA